MNHTTQCLQPIKQKSGLEFILKITGHCYTTGNSENYIIKNLCIIVYLAYAYLFEV